MAIVSPGARRRAPDSSLGRGVSVAARLAARPALLALALLALLVLVALLLPDRAGDEAGYLELARNVLDGRYAAGRPDALLDTSPDYPDLWFGPGFPLALALPVALGLPLEITRLIGPLCLFLALVVFFRFARRTLRPDLALLTTAGLSLYLPFYSVLPTLHSEPLAVLFVVLSLYATARVLEGAGARWLVAGSVALAGLALTRVDYGWVLTIALAALGVWWLASRRIAARRLVTMYALGLALCVPWLAYTTVETGRVLQWGNSGSLSLYWMSSPYQADLGDWRQADDVFSDPALAPHRPFFESLRGRPLAEQNAELERRALSNIARNPLKYLENVAANVSRMLFDTPYSQSEQRLSALYFALPNALLLGITLAASFVALRARVPLPLPAWPFLIFAVAAFGLHVFVSAYPRMLLPVVPVLAWLVAATLATNARLAEREAHGHG